MYNTIGDSFGNTLYSGTALCNANLVFFSSPTLTFSCNALTAEAQTGSIRTGMGGMGGS